MPEVNNFKLNKKKYNISFYILKKNFLLGIFLGFVLSFLFSVVIVNKLLITNKQLTYYIENCDYLLHDIKDVFILIEKDSSSINNLNNVGSLDLILRYGEDVFKLFKSANFNDFEIKNIMNIMYENIDFRLLKAGQKFKIDYDFQTIYQEYQINDINNILPPFYIKKEKRIIRNIFFKDYKDRKININRSKVRMDYNISIQESQYYKKIRSVNGLISTNLFTDIIESNISPTTLYQILNEYAFLIDFQRDLRVKDKFYFVLETVYNDDNEIKSDKVLYVNLILSGKKYELFRFNNEFFDRKGMSIRRSLLMSPIDGARISSGFGMRKHPILGYTRAHKGVDFAAVKGTPIYASGDGVITHSSWHGAYGKMVEIIHNTEFKTRYCHMSKIIVKNGQRIRQKQIIGYVGATGLATGPHLHYEVLRHNSHINPRSIKVSSTKAIDKKSFDQFNETKDYIDKVLNENA